MMTQLANPNKPGRYSWDAARARVSQGLSPHWMAPAGETEFECLVREAGIAVVDAHKHLMVQQWVFKNYRSKYVPLKTLKALGISSEEVCL